MIERLPSGWLIDMPGSGRVMLGLAALGFVVTAGWSLRDLGRRAALALVAAALVAGALGAWLADTIMTGVAVPVGLSLLGAALVGPAGVALAARGLGVDVARALDRIALPALGAAAIARLGCLLGGCELGRGGDLPWSVRYASGTPAFESLVRHGDLGAAAAMTPPFHPFPLYEVVGVLAALVVVWRLTALAPPGVRALAAGAGYFIARGLAELSRDGAAGPSLAVVSCFIGAGLVMAALSRRSSCRHSPLSPSAPASRSALPSP